MIEESKSAISHNDAGASPREFQSDISATPKGGGMGFNLQTPKGNIGGPPNIPTTTTNANRMSLDMS